MLTISLAYLLSGSPSVASTENPRKPDELVAFHRPHYAVMGSGAAIFALSYVTFAATLGSQTASWYPMVPLVGPFFVADQHIRKSQDPCTDPFCGFGRLGLFNIGLLSIFDGLVQVAGLSMLIGGALVRERLYRKAAPVKSLQALPYSAPGGGGVMVSGSF